MSRKSEQVKTSSELSDRTQRAGSANAIRRSLGCVGRGSSGDQSCQSHLSMEGAIRHKLQRNRLRVGATRPSIGNGVETHSDRA